MIEERAPREELETLKAEIDALRVREQELAVRDEARRLAEAASPSQGRAQSGLRRLLRVSDPCRAGADRRRPHQGEHHGLSRHSCRFALAEEPSDGSTDFGTGAERP